MEAVAVREQSALPIPYNVVERSKNKNSRNKMSPRATNKFRFDSIVFGKINVRRSLVF